MVNRDEVQIYTDGACKGNPGCGGWASILVFGEKEKMISGGHTKTTNNRMELMAVVNGLKALKKPCKVTVTSDSEYVVNAINRGWLKSWVSKNTLKDRPNNDLWAELLTLLDRHTVKFMWIKGHDGHPYNERCDKEAVRMAFKAQHYSAEKDNIEVVEMYFATEGDALEWKENSGEEFDSLKVTSYGVKATVLKKVNNAPKPMQKPSSKNSTWRENSEEEFEGQSQFKVRKQKQREQIEKQNQIKENQNWVVCAVVNGSQMFISQNGTTFVKSEAKRFTKEAAELKAKVLTKNSKGGYLWGVNRAC